MDERVVGLAMSALLGLGILLRRRREQSSSGAWLVLREVARALGAVMVERAHRTTTLRMLDRIDDGGRVRVIDSSGRQCVYEYQQRPLPEADREPADR